jgi:hypothetical protein
MNHLKVKMILTAAILGLENEASGVSSTDATQL